jgi:hypothetical protein
VGKVGMGDGLLVAHFDELSAFASFVGVDYGGLIGDYTDAMAYITFDVRLRSYRMWALFGLTEN